MRFVWTKPVHWLTECVVDADDPSHTLLTLDRREHFGGVLEGHRPFTQGVHDGEEVDESGKYAACQLGITSSPGSKDLQDDWTNL